MIVRKVAKGYGVVLNSSSLSEREPVAVVDKESRQPSAISRTEGRSYARTDCILAIVRNRTNQVRRDWRNDSKRAQEDVEPAGERCLLNGKHVRPSGVCVDISLR